MITKIIFSAAMVLVFFSSCSEQRIISGTTEGSASAKGTNSPSNSSSLSEQPATGQLSNTPVETGNQTMTTTQGRTAEIKN